MKRKHLFIDNRFVEETQGLERTFNEPEKYPGNPVIRADKPWERDAAFVDSGLVLYDEREGEFRAWYQGGACYGPNDKSNMCYVVSRDGIVWEKPNLGIVDFEGSSKNNIVLMAHCMMHDPAVIRDPQDPDPERRFKAVWWGGRKDTLKKDGWLLGHCVGFSPDGIHWTEYPGNPVWCGDAEVAVPSGLERKDGRHVMYSSADGYGMRVVARTESDDFINWQIPPKLVFKSDNEDLPGTEMAGLCAVDYEGTYIGILWVIRNMPDFTKEEWNQIVERNIRQGFFGPPIQMNATRCRIMYNELVTSLDGVKWQRVNRRPYLALGPAGSWDECICLPGRPIVANDRIYIYYTGHGRTKPTPGCSVPEEINKWNVDTGLATLRLDGFVSLDARQTEGILVTKKFKPEGGGIRINADARKGYVKVEILDENGQTVPGFTRDEAKTITGDNLRADVTWKGKNTVAAGIYQRDIRLKIYMKDARLFSICVE